MAKLIEKISGKLKSDPADTVFLSLAMEAANDGNFMAAVELGEHYKHKNLYRESLYWFTVAAEGDSGLSDRIEGDMEEIFVSLLHCLYSTPNESYLDILETYSNQHPFVANELGCLYDIGAVGVGRVDEKKAFQLYEKAAAAGYSEAQWNSSPNERSSEMLKAYSIQHLSAAFNPGTFFDFGVLGVGTVDDKKALHLCSKVEGIESAQWNLGLCYLNGRGVEKNKQLAMKWLQKSSQNGYEPASNYLKLMRATYSAPSEPFKWRISNFSSKFSEGSKLQSDTFSAHGSAWRVTLYPKGKNNNSTYIAAEIVAASLGSKAAAVHCLCVLVNFSDPLKHRVMEEYKELDKRGCKHFLFASCVRFARHTPISDIMEVSSGFLLEDAIVLEVIIEVEQKQRGIKSVGHR